LDSDFPRGPNYASGFRRPPRSKRGRPDGVARGTRNAAAANHRRGRRNRLPLSWPRLHVKETMMDGLVLRNLGRRFGAIDAVKDVNLHIQPGEFVSLLGPSGCGKTTTLRMIAGFLEPTDGWIELDGRALSSPGGSLPPEKRGMSMVFQSYAIW